MFHLTVFCCSYAYVQFVIGTVEIFVRWWRHAQPIFTYWYYDHVKRPNWRFCKLWVPEWTGFRIAVFINCCFYVITFTLHLGCFWYLMCMTSTVISNYQCRCHAVWLTQQLVVVLPLHLLSHVSNKALFLLLRQNWTSSKHVQICELPVHLSSSVASMWTDFNVREITHQNLCSLQESSHLLSVFFSHYWRWLFPFHVMSVHLQHDLPLNCAMTLKLLTCFMMLTCDVVL